MKIAVLNQKGETVSDTLLPKEIFEVPMNADLVHQVVSAQIANKRQKIAKTKDRAEVRGGGKKPWRQKGTGRARHGSIRSPLWKGGGVTFGPRPERVLKKKVTKKMKRKALFMVLSAKAKDKQILVLDNLELERPKTKLMAEILNKLFLKEGTGLVVLPKKEDNLIKSTRNIEGAKPLSAKDLNILDLLSYKYLLMPKDAIKVIKETFLK
jgi:large subunit ribosomal protein L4